VKGTDSDSNNSFEAFENNVNVGVCPFLASPGTARLDKSAKMQLFARYGVSWYWIADPDKRTLDEYRLDKATYTLQASVKRDETFRPRLFPGMEVLPERLWKNMLSFE
jgi:Uma2 family endonuclease